MRVLLSVVTGIILAIFFLACSDDSKSPVKDGGVDGKVVASDGKSVKEAAHVDKAVSGDVAPVDAAKNQ